MLPYLAIWAAPAAAALVPGRYGQRVGDAALAFAGVALVLFIGLRFEIGGDWYNYIAIHRGIAAAPGLLFFNAAEPGYALLNRLAGPGDGAIQTVNLVCAALFTAGALRFCRATPFPALALSMAIAYLGVVVAMGYTRQSAAIGLVMWGLVPLSRGRTGAYAACAIAAASFHSSAVVALPLLLAEAGPRARRNALLFMALALPALGIVASGYIASKFQAYVGQEMKSEGGAVRLAMGLLPAAFFLATRRRQAALFPRDARLWTVVSLFGLALVPLFPFSSTVVDRAALYLVPLQIVVWTRMPLMLGGPWRALGYLGVLMVYGATLIVWLSTSFYAYCCWIPYKWTL